LIPKGTDGAVDVEAFIDRRSPQRVSLSQPGDRRTRHSAVEALVDNADPSSRPILCEGVVLTRTDDKLLAVPGCHLHDCRVRGHVIENGKARQQQIALGARQNKLVEVRPGLTGDETVAPRISEQARDRRQVRWAPTTRSAGRRGASKGNIAEVSVKRPSSA